MTLEDYTNFVITFSKNIGEIYSLQAGRTKEMAILSLQELLNRALQVMMGYRRWETFSVSFYKEIRRAKEFDCKAISAACIYENQETFWRTLAEFCEPLLAKEVAKKTEGGQDVTKA